MKLKDFFKKAEREKWAIGQFNFSTLEILKGIVQAAKEMSVPLILGTSEKESEFLGIKEIVELVKISKKTWPFIFLNFDHGKSLESLKNAIELGYDAVHFDGSELSLKENIKITKKIVNYARKKGVLVEGEVGIIPKEKGKMVLTDPQEAFEFVEKTKVDSLAISIGNLHGLLEPKNYQLDFERLKAIKKKIGKKAFLVLHGGSGIKDSEIKKAIKYGIVKININTILRLTFTNSLKKILFQNKKEIVPYKYLPKVIQKIQKVVQEKILLFGTPKIQI